MTDADAIAGLRAEVEDARTDALNWCNIAKEQTAQLAEARAKCLEQSRLLGMSAERELALRARLAEARGALQAISDAYECDRSHVDFRVQAKFWADDALARSAGQGDG